MGNELGLGEKIREEFPIFSGADERVKHYLDSAATSQKPKVVIDRVSRFLSLENSNIHRGAYALSGLATEMYEEARRVVGRFINASDPSSIIFTKGTTDGINLVAQALAPLLKGRTILLSTLEHHSNIVPWQIVASRVGATIEWVSIQPDGTLSSEEFKRKIKTLSPALVAITQLSNALGTPVSVKEIAAAAHSVGSLVLVDGAQSVAHQVVDVQALDCDFLVFSGHKLYGPTGIGVLYGKRALLEELEPVQGGGGMISFVTKTGSTWASLPQKFEAGTPPIAEAIGLAEAITFIERLGIERISNYEDELLVEGVSLLRKIPGVQLLGPASRSDFKVGEQRGIISFTLNGIHPHDFATIADGFKVQIRAGHHCAMPLMEELSVTATCRASIGMYSTRGDFLALCDAIAYAQKKFGA